MKSSIRPIAIVTFSLFGFLLILSFYTEKSHLVYSANEMLDKISRTDYVVTSQEASAMENAQLIDLREAHEFELSNPEQGVLNIPLATILKENLKPFFQNDEPKILLAHDPMKTHEAWMLLTQMGYDNIYLQEM